MFRVTGLAVLATSILLQNFKTPQKALEGKIEQRHAVSDPQLKRDPGAGSSGDELMSKKQTKGHASPSKGKEKKAASDKGSPGKHGDKGG